MFIYITTQICVWLIIAPKNTNVFNTGLAAWILLQMGIKIFLFGEGFITNRSLDERFSCRVCLGMYGKGVNADIAPVTG